VYSGQLLHAFRQRAADTTAGCFTGSGGLLTTAHALEQLQGLVPSAPAELCITHHLSAYLCLPAVLRTFLPCLRSPTSSSSDTAVPGLSLATPASAAAAAGGGSGGGGFGFSFPTTPPSAVDAAVHEERAERVFSTWASNHSRSGMDAAGASDDEGAMLVMLL
jgi:hypothetical protein